MVLIKNSWCTFSLQLYRENCSKFKDEILQYKYFFVEAMTKHDKNHVTTDYPDVQ